MTPKNTDPLSRRALWGANRVFCCLIDTLLQPSLLSCATQSVTTGNGQYLHKQTGQNWLLRHKWGHGRQRSQLETKASGSLLGILWCGTNKTFPTTTLTYCGQLLIFPMQMSTGETRTVSNVRKGSGERLWIKGTCDLLLMSPHWDFTVRSISYKKYIYSTVQNYDRVHLVLWRVHGCKSEAVGSLTECYWAPSTSLTRHYGLTLFVITASSASAACPSVTLSGFSLFIKYPIEWNVF